MNSIMQQMMAMVENSPQFANNPNAREMLRCIKEGDAKKGEQIARNLCETYGIQPEQAVQNARNFFHL